MDALHVYAGVLLQVVIALVLRRTLRSPIPWLAVLVAILANEYYDYRYEVWPDAERPLQVRKESRTSGTRCCFRPQSCCWPVSIPAFSLVDRLQPPILVSRAARAGSDGATRSSRINLFLGRSCSAAQRRASATAIGRRARREKLRCHASADSPRASEAAAAIPLASAIAMPSPASDAMTAPWSPSR